MSEFKVGDKVKLRNDLTVKEMNQLPPMTEIMWEIVRHEKVLTIKDIDDVYCSFNEGNFFLFDLDWFELVPIHDFKIGDYVRMIKRGDGYISAKLNNVYKIVDIVDEDYRIMVGGHKQLFKKNDYYMGKFEKVNQI